eukprot:g1812.t1
MPRRTSALHRSARSRREPTGATYAVGSSIWSPKDKQALQAQLDPLQKDFRLRPGGWTRSPEVSSLICTQKRDVHERTLSCVTNLNIMSGLVLSATAQSALHPYDVRALDEKQQAYGIAFNSLAALTVTFNGLLVMYSTFYLIFLSASSSNAASIYRILAHSGRVMSILQFCSFMPTFGIFGMVIAAIHIHTPEPMCTVATCVITAVVVVLHVGVAGAFANAFPMSMWHWGALAAPWTYLRGGFRADAQRQGTMMMSEAAQGVFAGMDADGDLTVDSERQLSDAEQALVQWVDATLPGLGGEGAARRNLVVDFFLSQHLTLAALRDAARLPDGFMVLMQLFEFQGQGTLLTQGQRLVLATAAMGLAGLRDGSDHSSRPPGRRSERGAAPGGVLQQKASARIAGATVRAGTGGPGGSVAQVEVQQQRHNPMVARGGSGVTSASAAAAADV